MLERRGDGFVRDCILAVRAWRVDPRLPLLTLAIAFVTLVPSLLTSINRYFSFLSLFVLPVSLFSIGFYGTQRIWYLRLFRGEAIELSEVWYMSWRLLDRFFLLGLFAGLVLIPFAIVFYIFAFANAFASYTPGETSEQLISHVQYWPAVLILAVPTIFVDFALTFVTPALAYTTASIDRARRIGFRLTRTTWPTNALYVVFPPLALQLAATVPFSLDVRSRALVALSSLVVVMLNLIAKGATAAFYLWRLPSVSSIGSLAGEGEAPRFRDRIEEVEPI